MSNTRGRKQRIHFTMNGTDAVCRPSAMARVTTEVARVTCTNCRFSREFRTILAPAFNMRMAHDAHGM